MFQKSLLNDKAEFRKGISKEYTVGRDRYRTV